MPHKLSQQQGAEASSSSVPGQLLQWGGAASPWHGAEAVSSRSSPAFPTALGEGQRPSRKHQAEGMPRVGCRSGSASCFVRSSPFGVDIKALRAERARQQHGTVRQPGWECGAFWWPAPCWLWDWHSVGPPTLALWSGSPRLAWTMVGSAPNLPPLLQVLVAEVQSWMLMQFWGRTGAALAMSAKGSITLMSPSSPAAVSTESMQSSQALRGAEGCTQVATGETPARGGTGLAGQEGPPLMARIQAAESEPQRSELRWREAVGRCQEGGDGDGWALCWVY